MSDAFSPGWAANQRRSARLRRLRHPYGFRCADQKRRNIVKNSLLEDRPSHMLQCVTGMARKHEPGISLLPVLVKTREAITTKHYSIRTERTYVEWVHGFVRFHGQRHPRDMGRQRCSLSRASWRGKGGSNASAGVVGAAVLQRWCLASERLADELERPRKPKRLPVVLGHGEVGTPAFR